MKTPFLHNIKTDYIVIYEYIYIYIYIYICIKIIYPITNTTYVNQIVYEWIFYYQITYPITLSFNTLI